MYINEITPMIARAITTENTVFDATETAPLTELAPVGVDGPVTLETIEKTPSATSTVTNESFAINFLLINPIS